MLKYFGITELVGDINTGKTSVCIEESKKYYTLYITTTNFPIKRLSSPDDTIYIKLVQSLDEIPIILTQCKLISIELLIIDNFSSLLDEANHSKIIKIIYYLKKLINKNKMKVLIVNNCNNLFLKSKIYYIYKLGLEWEYHVNTRYYLSKDKKNINIEIKKCPIDLEFKYRLEICISWITYTKLEG
ncbi:hypothetical protein NCER_101201 [Vairimorpha ceranae BRL01]|uniref:Uncharacterized protein n=1 Tax=Vairimorpha ceranae (strain BRL01) TaxID=578460 RepID=C4V9G2_VAIC1|nr:hypothetical protein NCER_101201 [Vairimorpha ceranae BRL01]